MEGKELKWYGIGEGPKIFATGWENPLGEAIKIQEALKPLGYIVHGFENAADRGLYSLLLMPTKHH